MNRQTLDRSKGPTLSLNSYVGDLHHVDNLGAGSEVDKQALIRWCGDVQGQTLTHIERLSGLSRGVELSAPHRADLVEFLAGVGKVITRMANEVRDSQDLETHNPK